MPILKPEFTSTDKRRKLIQLFTGNVQQVNFYESEKGAILGDHYHKLTGEYFYILKGSFLMQFGSPSSRLRQTQVVNKGNLFFMPAMIHHTVECISQKGEFLTFLTMPYDHLSPDVFKESK